MAIIGNIPYFQTNPYILRQLRLQDLKEGPALFLAELQGHVKASTAVLKGLRSSLPGSILRPSQCQPSLTKSCESETWTLALREKIWISRNMTSQDGSLHESVGFSLPFHGSLLQSIDPQGRGFRVHSRSWKNMGWCDNRVPIYKSIG